MGVVDREQSMSKLSDWIFTAREVLSTPIVTGTAVNIIRYLAFWALVWLGTWLLISRWLVSTTGGFQLLLEVVPTVVVAVLVFVLGSLLIIMQQTTSAYSTRASLVVISHSAVPIVVIQPLLILIASLILSGQIPDLGPPNEAVSALAGTIALATIWMIIGSATRIPLLMAKFTAPKNFSTIVLHNVEEDLNRGSTDQLVYRVGLLGQMLTRGIRNNDFPTVNAAIHGLRQFQDAYFDAASGNQEARVHAYEYDDEETVGWLGKEMEYALVPAGEAALSTDAEHIVGHIATTLRDFGIRAGREGYPEEVDAVGEGLAHLATSVLQVRAHGLIQVFTEPVACLARIENACEQGELTDQAANTLAFWSLTSSYCETQLEMGRHPLWQQSVELMGPNPPFAQAEQMIMSEDFQIWANKMPGGNGPVVNNLRRAQRAHLRLHN